jgi:hypothetical protein
MSDDVLSTVYLILILALILPGFIYANKNKKIFLKNLLLWSIIVVVIVLVLSLV